MRGAPSKGVAVRIALLVLGFGLVVPGLMQLIPISVKWYDVSFLSVESVHQIRVLHAMMVGLGLIALFCLTDINRFNSLIRALAVLLICVVLTRLYSFIIDGMPGFEALAYCVLEFVMVMIFLSWKPVPER